MKTIPINKKAPAPRPMTREEKLVTLRSAEATAIKIREQTVGQWFTADELKICIRRPFPVCQQLINQLSVFLLLETAVQNGRKRHRINMDRAWRLEQAELVKKEFINSIQQDLDFLDELSTIIKEIHPEAPGQTPESL